jgi:dienelactone hydrolase
MSTPVFLRKFFQEWGSFTRRHRIASCPLPFFVRKLPAFGPLFLTRYWLFTGLMLSFTSQLAAADNAIPPTTGRVRFEPPASESFCPERFRLAAHEFAYEMRPREVDSARFEVADVTFPSPVETPYELNNTVHAEYYQPRQPGKRPAVIVLHILGGDFALARLFCHSLNQSGTAALFVKMPYYGPRRPPGVKRRMVADDPEETVEGMTQAVLDIRRATAFLAAREEVDPERIGIVGVSLGGITAALAAEAEPRIQRVCLLLAGGDFPKIAAESREFARQREAFRATGKNGEEFNRIIREVDPLTYAERLKGRTMLMINAKDDEVIPPACTTALWEAAGKPEIVWFDGGHYSMIRHLPAALHRANRFFESQ